MKKRASKKIVFADVQKFQKWLSSKEQKTDGSVFVKIGGQEMLVGAVVGGRFAKTW